MHELFPLEKTRLRNRISSYRRALDKEAQAFGKQRTALVEKWNRIEAAASPAALAPPRPPEILTLVTESKKAPAKKKTAAKTVKIRKHLRIVK